MAKRGRKPKPTAQKRRAGNPGRRPLNDSEPKPAAKAPKMPKHLNPVGRKAWRWLCGELGSMQLLATSDLAVMTIYCDTWSEYLKIRALVDKEGMTLVSRKTGSAYVNPVVNVEAMLKKQLMTCLVELGLSPSSRSRVHAMPAPPAADDKAKFFKVVGA